MTCWRLGLTLQHSLLLVACRFRSQAQARAQARANSRRTCLRDRGRRSRRGLRCAAPAGCMHSCAPFTTPACNTPGRRHCFRGQRDHPRAPGAECIPWDQVWHPLSCAGARQLWDQGAVTNCATPAAFRRGHTSCDHSVAQPPLLVTHPALHRHQTAGDSISQSDNTSTYVLLLNNTTCTTHAHMPAGCQPACAGARPGRLRLVRLS